MINLISISNPVRIILDVTRKCNLKCWYCHSTSGPNYKGPEIDPNVLPQLFREAEEAGVLEITITGGEPTLWKGLEQLMLASHELKLTSLQLITNATVITDKTLEILKKGNLKRICISLDGPEHVHTRNRGSGMYQRTIVGIQRLREVVDNITIISVIDNSTVESWPELTRILIDAGVSQHHLAPVCFAGNAMDQYKGITREQFHKVRAMVDKMSNNIPKNFILRFNDSLVMGIPSRTMTMQTFSEKFKGWHVVIRPTGEVKTSVRAWGRTWRDDEVMGNVHQENLSNIFLDYRTIVSEALQKQFSPDEEQKRKFHLGTDIKTISLDLEDVQSVNKGGIGTHTINVNDTNSATININQLPLGVDLNSLAKEVVQNSSHYIIKKEDGFFILFDTVTFDISILTQDEKRMIIS